MVSLMLSLRKMFIHYKLDNQIKKFYQNSDIYQKMLSSLEEKDFLDYISLVKYWLPVGSTYLDVGCGTGQGAFYLSQIGYKVTGVDFSARLIDTAKQNFPNINFYQADALQLPFSNNSFDAVGSHCVIEHITDVSKFLAEQIRVVKKRGINFYLCS